MWDIIKGAFGQQPEQQLPQSNQDVAGQALPGSSGFGEAQRLPPPPLYIANRIISNTCFYFTWIPYIILIATRETDPGFRCSLIFGVAFSGWCFLFQLFWWWPFKQKTEPGPYMLDGFFLIFFIVYLALWERREDYRWDMAAHMTVVVHAWLSFCMLVSIAVRYPFTLQYAKEAAPQMAWGAPSLRAVCDQMAGMWATTNGITCLLCLAPLLTDRYQGKDGLNVFFNYVWPYLMLLTNLVLTRWWPGFIRVRVYIPRMLANSVAPERTTGGAAAGSGASGAPAAPAASATNPAQPGGQAAQGSQQAQPGAAPPAPGAAGQPPRPGQALPAPPPPSPGPGPAGTYPPQQGGALPAPPPVGAAGASPPAPAPPQPGGYGPPR